MAGASTPFEETTPVWPTLVSTLVNIVRAANEQDMAQYAPWPPGMAEPERDPRVNLKQRQGLDVLLPRIKPVGGMPTVLFVYSSCGLSLGTREMYQALATDLAWKSVCSVALFDCWQYSTNAAAFAENSHRASTHVSRKSPRAEGATSKRTTARNTRTSGTGGAGTARVAKKSTTSTTRSTSRSPTSALDKSFLLTSDPQSAASTPASSRKGTRATTDSPNAKPSPLDVLEGIFEDSRPDFLVGDSQGATLCLLLLARLSDRVRRKKEAKAAAAVASSSSSASNEEVSRNYEGFETPLSRNQRGNQERGVVVLEDEDANTDSSTPLLRGGVILLSPWVDLTETAQLSTKAGAHDYLTSTVLTRVAHEFAEQMFPAPPAQTNRSSASRTRTSRDVDGLQQGSRWTSPASSISKSRIENKREASSSRFLREQNSRRRNSSFGSSEASSKRRRASVDSFLSSEGGASTQDGEGDGPWQDASPKTEKSTEKSSTTQQSSGRKRAVAEGGGQTIEDDEDDVDDTPPGVRETGASSLGFGISEFFGFATRESGEKAQKRSWVDAVSPRGHSDLVTTLEEQLKRISPLHRDFTAKGPMVNITTAKVAQSSTGVAAALGGLATERPPLAHICSRLHIIYGGRELLRDQIREFARRLVAEYNAKPLVAPRQALIGASTGTTSAPATEDGVHVRVDELPDLCHSMLPL
ncbi:unnamed protein product, partial [Amoebophrya sp. A25]|eukprot:GSA25T00015965001.1